MKEKRDQRISVKMTLSMRCFVFCVIGGGGGCALGVVVPIVVN